MTCIFVRGWLLALLSLGVVYGQSSGSVAGERGTAEAHAATGPILQSPPVMTAAEKAARDLQRQHVNLPTPLVEGAPAQVPTAAASPSVPAPGEAGTAVGPTDFLFQTTHDFRSPGTPSASAVLAPGVGSAGSTLFYTTNWYAARSMNGGKTFTYVDPYTTFPPANQGFCCDQVVNYAAAQNMMLWTLMYGNDASGNTIRIARAVGSGAIAANSWTYYDFSAQQFGFAAGAWLDFPNITAGATYLYATANVFTASNTFSGSVMWRIPLTELATGGAAAYTYWARGSEGSLRCSEGAGSTIYCGTQLGNSTIRIFRVEDNSTVMSWDDVAVPAFAYLNQDGIALSADGTNWAASADSRILGAWVARGLIGMIFHAKQDADHPYPYTIGVRFREDTREFVDRTDIWNPEFAWLYPSVSVNAAGDVAGVLYWGGGSYYPSAAAWTSGVESAGSGMRFVWGTGSDTANLNRQTRSLSEVAKDKSVAGALVDPTVSKAPPAYVPTSSDFSFTANASAAGDQAEMDVFLVGSGVQYVAIALDSDGGSASASYPFLKIQQSFTTGVFDTGACYLGNNGAAGTFGLSFFNLTQNFSSAHMQAIRSGSTVTINFTNINGGALANQSYTCTGAPAAIGNKIGVGGYAGSAAQLDNFGDGTAVYDTFSYVGALGSTGNWTDAAPGMTADGSRANGSNSAVSFWKGSAPISITIQTAPINLSMVVDDISYTSPHTFNWLPNSSHSISVASPQGGQGTQYVFNSWSDFGAQSHQIIASPNTPTYTANFITQYLLTTTVLPVGAASPGFVTASPSSSNGYYNSGTSVQLTANASAGWVFSSWSGNLSGATNPQSITMNAPRSVTANFAAAVSVTVTTNPAGRAVVVDGSTLTAPQTFNWVSGSTHSIGVTSPQGSGGTQYVFSNWSDSGAQTHNITVPTGPTTYTANFVTQYLLTTAVSPPGSGTITANPASGNGYYNSGTSVQLTAVANTGFLFGGWSGDLSGGTNPQSLTMSAPHTVTALFGGCSYSVSPGSASAAAGGASGSTGLSATAGCSWTLVSDSPWIHITSVLSSSGNTTITYTVDANTSGAARTGAIHVLNLSGKEVVLPAFTITQAAPACISPSLSPSGFTFGSGAGSGSASFNTSGCSWGASVDVGWVHLSATSGSNSAPVAFTVDANGSSIARGGTITVTVGGSSIKLKVTQTGVTCSYTISNPSDPHSQSQSFGAAGGPASIHVTAPGGCAWNAQSNSAAVHTTASGSGTADAPYTMDANTTGKSRTATITIAGLNYSISQAASAQEGYSCVASATPVIVRKEGGAEKIADLTMTCNGFGAGNVRGDVVISLNTPVTNHLLSTDTSGQTTDALLLIDEPQAGALTLNSNVLRGQPFGPNAIRFANALLELEAGSFSHRFRITNVRAFAQNMTVPSTIQATVTINAGVPFSISSATQTVGNVVTGNSFVVGTAGSGPSGLTLQPLSFSEGAATAYRPKVAQGQDPSAVGVTYNAESGYVNTAVLGTETGFATSGTRLLAKFSNVPAGVTLYAPVGASSGGSAQLMSADANGNVGFPVQGNTVIGGLSYQTVVLNGGSGSATWEVTGSNPSTIETLAFNMLIAPNGASVSGIQYTGSLAAVSTVAGESVTAPVPRFIGAATPPPATVNVSIAPVSSAQLPSVAHLQAMKVSSWKAALAPADGAGGTITITEILSNNATTSASNVVVGGSLPASWTITSCDAGQDGSCSKVGGNQISATFPTLSPGQSPIITISAQTPTVTSPVVAFNSSVVSDSLNTNAIAAAFTSYATVNGSITLVGNPSALSFSYVQESPPPSSQTVQISSTGATVLVLPPNTTCSWLSLSLDRGVTPLNLTATPNTNITTLQGGPNNCSISLTTNAGASLTIPVLLNVGINSRAFVTQLYQDILGRAPDAGGLALWMQWIDTGKYTKESVAAQFFRSQEFAQDGVYITKLYEGIMLRDPDFGGWTGWLNFMQQGHTQNEVLNAFLGSPEFQSRYGNLDNTAFVSLLYQNILKRPADANGLAQWVAWLGSGTFTRAQVANSFITSQEFHNGIINRVYVNMLYIAFLRRIGETAGLNQWLYWISNGTYTLDQEVAYFINSPEYLSRFKPGA